MKKHPLLLVVCDWNGTLLDDLGLVYASVVEIFTEYGLPPPSLGAYRSEITADYMTFYRQHGIPGHVTAEDINAKRKHYFEHRWNEACLHRHAEELLHCLEQLQLCTGIVSAETEEMLLKRLQKQFRLDNFFDKIIGNARNKEEALLKMLGEFNFKPDEAAYVDDTYDGLMAARNIGMLPIGVTHGYGTPEHIREAQPDELCVAHSLSEVQRIIEHKVRRRKR